MSRADMRDQHRAKRNEGLPRGIRLKASGQYEVRGMKIVPGEHVKKPDGSYGPVIKRVSLGHVSSLADAIRIRADFMRDHGVRDVE